MTRYIIIGLITAAVIAVAGFVLLNRGGTSLNTQTASTETGMRYVALGDSYTIGEGEAEANRWPNQLVAQLKDQNIQLNLVANPSRTGYSTQDLLDREISVLKEENPLFITLQIGVNDYFQGVSASEFKQRFQTVLDTIQSSAPNAKLLVVTIPDYGKTPAGGRTGKPETIEAGIREYNQIISDEAAKRNLPVADVFAASQDSAAASEFVDDGLHPSAAQYTKWLQTITPAAVQLLR